MVPTVCDQIALAAQAVARSRRRWTIVAERLEAFGRTRSPAASARTARSSTSIAAGRYFGLEPGTCPRIIDGSSRCSRTCPPSSYLHEKEKENGKRHQASAR
jgi:hypothetical protein